MVILPFEVGRLLSVWGMSFLACVAFTFAGVDVEQAADSACRRAFMSSILSLKL
jgi:hypothetical protein